MFEPIKAAWRTFAAEPPGCRFERHYERTRDAEAHIVQRCAWIAAGVFFLIAGIVMLFTPGPGLLAIAFAITCFVRESLALARSCDRTELRVRAAWTRWRDRNRGG